MILPFSGMDFADAVKDTDKIQEHKTELDKRIKNLEKASDFNTSKKQAEHQFYNVAIDMLTKMEEKSGLTDQKEIDKLDKKIGKDVAKLDNLVRQFGTVIEATPVQLDDNGNPLNTLSVTPQLLMNTVIEAPITFATYVDEAPITEVTSGYHVFTTLHSRNDCQSSSNGSTAGSLFDTGSAQTLAVNVSYPSTIKSGFFPNCSTHSWSSGTIAFVDVFNGTICSSTLTNYSGWHGGNCSTWASVGSLTIANVNGLYSSSHWYQIVPAFGFVV